MTLKYEISGKIVFGFKNSAKYAARIMIFCTKMSLKRDLVSLEKKLNQGLHIVEYRSDSGKIYTILYQDLPVDDGGLITGSDDNGYHAAWLKLRNIRKEKDRNGSEILPITLFRSNQNDFEEIICKIGFEQPPHPS